MTKKTFEGLEIIGWQGEELGKTYENIVFEKCFFTGVRLGDTDAPDTRTVFRNIILKNCSQRSCILREGIFEEIKILTLHNKSLIQTWGALFKHCTIEGKVGRWMFSNQFDNYTGKPDTSFLDYTRKYYSKVDWALDISKAEFLEFNNRSIPGDLIKRDKETQVIIRREILEQQIDATRAIDFEETYYETSLAFFLTGELDSTVLLAPKMDTHKFEMNMRVINRLVAAGLAEY